MGARSLVTSGAVLPVHPPPEEALEASLRAEQPRLSVRMPEGVDLPRTTRVGRRPKVLNQELVPTRRLVHHVSPQRRRLVVHAPPAVDELELLGGHEVAHKIATVVGRLLPPACEEGNLHVDELPVRIARERIHDRVYDIVHILGKVLIDRDEPAGVIVRVWHEVDVDLAGHRPALSVVLASHRVRVRRGSAGFLGQFGPELDGGRRVAKETAVRHGELILREALDNVPEFVVASIQVAPVPLRSAGRGDG